jgi:RNA polymerase primary sigma factor
MKERDVFKAIMGKGLKHGVLTVDEINDALPVGSFSLDRLENLMVVLDELGVKVVDYGERLN